MNIIKEYIIKLLTLSFLSSLILSCNSREIQNENSNIKKTVNTSKISSLSYKELEYAADSLYQNSDYSEAVDYYTKLLTNDSLNGIFFYRRAYSYGQLLQFDSSILDYEKSVKLGYRNFDAYYSLGIIYKGILNDSLALHYLKMALNEDPSSQKVKDLIFDVKNADSKII